MMKKMKLADVPFGKNFEIWGHEYTVLDGDDIGQRFRRVLPRLF